MKKICDVTKAEKERFLPPKIDISEFDDVNIIVTSSASTDENDEAKKSKSELEADFELGG